MTTQPDPNASSNAWSWTVQRELDDLKRGTNQRLENMATRVGSSVSNVEYVADKRTSDLQILTIKDKMDDIESDISTVKADMVKSHDELKRDNAAEHSSLRQAIQAETLAREKQTEKDVTARQSQFRWMISAVLVPIVLAIMDLMLNKK